MSFERLVRFVDEENNTHYGNITTSLENTEESQLKAQVLSGSWADGFVKTGDIKPVKKLLNPVVDAVAVLCVGLNYRSHVAETKSFVPTKPVVFMTPAERLCGPTDEIEVHEDAQSMLDYEGELAFVIGTDAKDVSEENSLDYVLGYTVANDVSARNLVTMEVAFNQMGHSKSFDTFGPIGPCVVSTSVIQNPQDLHLTTKVNGEVRQRAHTSDMVWTVRQLIAWLSKNRTLKRGTVVMTGTPGGVGWHCGGMLQNGDVVTVEISDIGTINNKVTFLSSSSGS